jgi:glycosyltransferase involved in cell wall biosynthesis
MCNELPELWNNPNPLPPLRILRDIGVVYDKYFVKKYVDAICVSDEINAKRIIRRYGMQPHIVHYGIDYDFFSIGNENRPSQKFNLHNAFIVLQVGWLSPQKNQLESIKAVEKLRDKIPHIKLILVGSGHGYLYETMLKSYVSKKGLNNHVIFLGHQPREEVRDLYHACHILVHPVGEQGGWLTPFEALCASKPIIVSPSMNAASIIEKEKIGIATNDLAKAILDVYNNPKPYQDMARRGKRWVADNLSWDKFGQRMVEVFESVIKC